MANTTTEYEGKHAELQARVMREWAARYKELRGKCRKDDDVCQTCLSECAKNPKNQTRYGTIITPTCDLSTYDKIQEMTERSEWDTFSPIQQENFKIAIDPVYWAAARLRSLRDTEKPWSPEWYQIEPLKCLPGDQVVYMADGTVKRMDEIKVGDMVIGYDERNRKTRAYPVTNTFDQGIQDVYRITLWNGDSLKCTSNHEILSHFKCGKENLLHNCLSHKTVYKSIDDGLCPGDKVYTLNEFSISKTPIKKIEYVGKERVYDIEVARRHNFIAQGVIVHNCTARKLLLLFGRQVGKCLTEETRVDTYDGRRIPVKDLEGQYFDAISMDGSSLISRRAFVTKNIVKPCVRVTLKSGREAGTSTDHPFRAFDHWIEAGDLQPGDRVATVDRGALGAQTIVWDEVVSVEVIGNQQTYSVTVLDTDNYDDQNFAAEGIITHNTEVLAVKVLFRLDTRRDYKIVVVCPYQAQVSMIYTRLVALIEASPELRHRIKRKRENPHHEIQFDNGSFVRLFTAGGQTGKSASDVRGQSADWLVMDEADYLDNETLVTILATLTRAQDPEIFVSSTPTGKRGQFYEWATDPTHGFRKLHCTSMEAPEWNEKDELFLRKTYSAAYFAAEYCLDGQTPVPKADGTTSKIKDLCKGDLVFYPGDNGTPVEVLDWRQTRRSKKVKIRTCAGSLCGTPDHKLKARNGKKIHIQDAKEIGYVPITGHYLQNRAAATARLVAWSLGDGTITCDKMPSDYKNNGLGRPPKHRDTGTYRAHFYSKYEADLMPLKRDLEYLFPGESFKISKKPGTGRYKGTFTREIACSTYVSLFLLEHGAVAGKKTRQVVTFPKWLWDESQEIRLEFVATLFGAEGNTPKVEKGSSLHSLSLSMVSYVDSPHFLTDVQKILTEADIPTTLVPRDDGEATTWILYVTSRKSILNFFERVGFRYAIDKEIKAFQLKHFTYYINEEIAKRDKTCQEVRTLYAEGLERKEIAARLGITPKRVQFFGRKDIPAHSDRPPHSALSFGDWFTQHWSGEMIFHPVVECHSTGFSKVYNITVDSPDHSYVLGDGTVTFNCAEFGSLQAGVFKRQYIDAPGVIQDYDIENPAPIDGEIYSLGVDWNSKGAGGVLCIVGFNPDINAPNGQRFRVAYKEVVDPERWTQTEAVNAVLRLSRFWKPKFIYVDFGHGEMQVEVLQRYGLQHRETGLHKKVKGIMMQSNIEIQDPLLKRPVKKQAKNMMVEMCAARLEQGQVVLPQSEDFQQGLVGQIREYEVEYVGRNGNKVYTGAREHLLTAWMLAIFGFIMEGSDLTKSRSVSEIAILDNNLENALHKAIQIARSPDQMRKKRPKPPGSRAITEEKMDVINTIRAINRGAVPPQAKRASRKPVGRRTW